MGVTRLLGVFLTPNNFYFRERERGFCSRNAVREGIRMQQLAVNYQCLADQFGVLNVQFNAATHTL